MALNGREIAVIGAGVGGLAAAAALARRGARVQIFEQAPMLAEVGAGLQLGPNGVAVMEALGLRGAAETVAGVPEAIELRDYRSGRLVARVPLGRACVARYGRPYWHLHRADLLGVLAKGAAEAGAALRVGARVEAVAQTREGVRLALADGTRPGFELAVAADGARSVLRGASFGGEPPRFTGHVAWRGLVPAARLPPDLFPRAACVTMGPRRHLVTYPLRGGSVWNFVAVEERSRWVEESWTRSDDPANLRAAFGDWNPAVKTLLGAVEDTFVWGLFDHPPLPRWVKGGLALLGDACHPMLPFLAQGAAMALEDAWALAVELAAAPGLAAGLAAYEDGRRARAARVQRAAARGGRLYHLASPSSRAVAHLALRAASLAPGALIGRLDWLYGADVVGAEANG